MVKWIGRSWEISEQNFSALTLTATLVNIRWATEIRLETQYPRLKAVERGTLNGNLLARDHAGPTHLVPRELTHARAARRITNIVFRMRVPFHFHGGFTGQRDYQSRGRAHSFLNLRSTTFVLVPSVRSPRFRCHRGYGRGKIAIRQARSYRGGKIMRPVA